MPGKAADTCRDLPFMKFLLTNDDGFDAPGLQALLEAAEGLGECVVVAPSEPLSGCSHRVTTHEAMRVEGRGPSRYSLAGTPADCVRIGLRQLAADVDWVLSGINQGGNLGADVFYSGTVAAVREGVLEGVPGIAVSQYSKKDLPIDWTLSARWVRPLLEELLQAPRSAGSFWNINLPHLGPGSPDPPTVCCPLDLSPLPVTFRKEAGGFLYAGNYHQRRYAAGTDVDVCFRGEIAVTRVRLG